MENKKNIQPTLEEIIIASKPDATDDYRAYIKSRLKGFETTDTALAGAILFLETHKYDFDALNAFLDLQFEFHKNQKKIPVIQSVNFLTVAAIFLLFIGIGWFYNYNTYSERIITKSIIYEPGLPVFASISGNNEFHELMSAYRMQDTKTGFRYFHELIFKEPSNDTLNYFGGWLYYLNKQTDSAAISFKKVVELKSEAYQQKASFMLAICLYMNSKKAESKLVFQNISQDKTSTYKDSAANIIANKRLW